MSIRSRLHSWWRALVRRSLVEDEIESELNFHVEAYAADLMLAGVAPEEARRRAQMELGPAAAQKENFRVSVGLRLWDDLGNDLRYAVRQLRHAPAFTLTVLLVLALGIGANAAMFSIIDVTLLRRLPYERAGRLVSLGAMDGAGKPSWLFLPDIEEWQRHTRTLSGLAYYRNDSTFAESPAGGRRLTTPRVSWNFFDVLGTHPAMGRDFLAVEQIPGRNKVVVLSDPVWKSLFAGDPGIVGKSVRLNDELYTVIGVMPPRFLFPADENPLQMWVPAAIDENSGKRDFSAGTYDVIARMRDGIMQSQTSAELTAIQKNLAPLYKKLNVGSGPERIETARYRDTLVKNVRPALTALLVAVGMIWLIACGNVASLMLARAAARQREIAVRGALGASRGRILRQLFTESLLLSVCGAAAGLALSQMALKFFSKVLSARLNLTEHLSPNLAVLAALTVFALVSSLLFGFFPAWLAARVPIEKSLRLASTQTGQSRERHLWQQAIVIGEVGLSLVLLMGCGLMLRSVYSLRRVPLGFRTDHVLLIEPQLPSSAFRGTDAVRAVYRPLLERVQQMKGVEAASLTTVLPLRKTFQLQVTMYLGGPQGSTPAKRIDATLKAAGPELQNVLAFHMHRGRYFTPQDTQDSQPVAVVNRAFADLYGAENDLLNNFSLGLTKERKAKIVGIMDDFHQASIDRPSEPEIDFCASQLRPGDSFYQPAMQAHIELALRTAREPSAIIGELRKAMAEVNPELESSTMETMDEVVEDSLGSQMLAAHLLELFAGSALVVVLAGLYGLLMYLVTQRNRELGVRLALGAQRATILQMLLSQAGKLLLAGVTIGLALVYFTTRLLSTLLYGVSPHDAVTMAGVTALLLACGLLAAYLPARKASLVDPLEALRSD